MIELEKDRLRNTCIWENVGATEDKVIENKFRWIRHKTRVKSAPIWWVDKIND